MRFLKNTFNFTRSCAFAQNAKFHALKMLKKQNLTHPKAAKLATLNVLLVKPIVLRVKSIVLRVKQKYYYILIHCFTRKVKRFTRKTIDFTRKTLDFTRETFDLTRKTVIYDNNSLPYTYGLNTVQQCLSQCPQHAMAMKC